MNLKNRHTTQSQILNTIGMTTCLIEVDRLLYCLAGTVSGWSMLWPTGYDNPCMGKNRLLQSSRMLHLPFQHHLIKKHASFCGLNVPTINDNESRSFWGTRCVVRWLRRTVAFLSLSSEDFEKQGNFLSRVVYSGNSTRCVVRWLQQTVAFLSLSPNDFKNRVSFCRVQYTLATVRGA